jgi:hypothetical protein
MKKKSKRLNQCPDFKYSFFLRSHGALCNILGTNFQFFSTYIPNTPTTTGIRGSGPQKLGVTNCLISSVSSFTEKTATSMTMEPE